MGPAAAAAEARYYLDTSAYGAILLKEPPGLRLAAELAGTQVLSSVLLVLEATRTLIRMSREGTLSPEAFHGGIQRIEEDLTRFTLRDLTIDLCRGLAMPTVSLPRSLDLAHLRTAAWFHERAPLTRFVSLDRVQNSAARELGLPV